MRILTDTELFLLGEGEALKGYIDGAALYNKYKKLVAELNACKPEVPEGKKLMIDPFVGYVLVDAE